MRRRAALVLAAFAAATPAARSAQPLPIARPGTEGFSAERLARLGGYLDAATAPGGHLGAVALVARRGRIVHWSSHGHRDLARRQPMPRDAIFRIHSMTKPIASVALLSLLEEGRVALDDPVARHLPSFAGARVYAGGGAEAPQLRPPARPPTVRDLLTHTAGFATAGGVPQRLLEAAAPAAAADLDGFAQRVASVPLAADPGTRFQYDGVNTEVLSRLIEVVAGEGFEAFLQRRLFGPLAMPDTGFAVPTAQRGRVADLSVVGPAGGLERAPGRSAAMPGEPINAYASGAGGLYSTASDYLRFAQMLLEGGALAGVRVLGRKTVELMTTNQLPHLDPIAGLSPGEGFGLGVSVVIDPARRGRLSSAGAYGWSGSASTYFTVDPRERMIAMLLMQHLPRDGTPGELPKHGVAFYNLVYQALVA